MARTRRCGPDSWALSAILAGGAFALAPRGVVPLAWSQPGQPAGAGLSPAEAGAAFAQTRLPLPTVPGVIRLRANRVHSWDDQGVRRVTLVGDVRVALGDRELRAARGAAFLRTVDGAGQGATQVFVYLEDVGDPALPAGAGLTAERLPVRAIVATTDATIEGDLVVDGPPSAARAADARVAGAGAAALAESLSRVAGAAPPPPPPLPRFTPRTPGERAVPPRRTTGRAPAPERVASGPERRSPETPPTTQQPRTQQPTTRQPLARQPGPPAQPRSPAGESPRPTPEGRPSTPAPTAPAPESPGSSTPAPPPPAPPPTGAPIFAGTGVLTLAPGDVTIQAGADESAVVATGGVTIQYADASRDRVVQLTARRAVIFLDPGSVRDLLAFDASRVRGVYLEGDVTASDGTYTVRGPQVYYDLRANTGVMLDAVFSTYDESREVPLYVRAKTVRQTAADTFTAEQAVFTTSPFFKPELSIGASKVTVTRKAPPVDTGADPGAAPPRPVTWIEASDVTGRFLGVPFVYWPSYAGDPESRIIKDFRVENRSGSGAALLTTVNAYALFGASTPRNVSVDLLADFYFERGPGVGVKAAWNAPDSRGNLLAYTVPMDRGTDVLKSGAEIDRDEEFRGIVLGEHRLKLDEQWTVLGELAYISDEAFVDAFFEDLGETRREFTNRAAARRLDRHTAFSVEIEGSFNDFLANEYLLQSQGYSVTRTPEITYARLADDLLGPGHPGLLTWFSEYRAGRLEMAFDEVLARERGLTSNALAQRGQGTNADERLSDVLRARGLFEDAVYRLDSRQELSLQTDVGPVRVNPFIVGRTTLYDTDFEAYSPEEDDALRLWGAAGLRLSTTLQRVYDGVDVPLLDIHRVRHIVEPNVTVWSAGTTVERGAIPVYDADVEDILEGTVIRVGVNQLFQTQRGGEGRWHDVDLLTISTDFVFSSDETGARSPIGRFFEFRPEYSNPGDYFVVDAVLRLTEAASLTGSSVYDLDESEQAMTSVGVLVLQGSAFTAALDVRYLNPQDATYVTLGLAYELTPKYSVTIGANYDTDESKLQTIAALFQRRFASLTVGVGVSSNEITGETGLSVVVRPYGASSGLGFSETGVFDSRLGGN
ncbi:MAG: LPS assembly protein LptD [Planctomycetota bacterium]|nr:LPS assembly protein LptD [Planctomycetota bacterium]